jgi:hypothetical protein
MLHPRIRSVAIASLLSLPIVSVMTKPALADKSNFYVYNDSESVITQLSSLSRAAILGTTTS